MLAESVMGLVNQRFPATAYAFQDQQLGTGDAARKGAAILEALNFKGDVLVVAGDKVIDPGAIRALMKLHEKTEADVTLATARRPENSSAGILISNKQGNILGILEEGERQRLAGLGRIGKALTSGRPMAREAVERIIADVCGRKAKGALIAELFPTSGNGRLTAEAFKERFSPDERKGIIRTGNEQVPAERALARFNQMNMATYVFRAPVLFDALARLKLNRSTNEMYLTDVFEILAKSRPPARVVGCEVQDQRDLMAFNNPQELLAIEEAYRAREGSHRVEAVSAADRAIPEVWKSMFREPSARARQEFKRWYGDDIPWKQFTKTVDAFAGRYGNTRPIALVRSPGRINLMGRHIDHQGGTVNVMAVNREIVVAAAARDDDMVSLANADETHFAPQVFRISDLVANLNWDDWQRVIDGPRLQRILENARGDWANYVKASILRLQELFRDRRLRGADIMVSGNIPMGAGLSSSSALVVAAAEIMCSFNNLPVNARRLVSLCGEGEWFVGTRGGAADHAAIKLSRRGCVTRVGFFPFRIEDSAPFFNDYDLVVCNSGIYAGKSGGARNMFNSKVAAYHIARVWVKMLRPDLAPKIEHLRDVNRANLGLSHEEFGAVLSQLPARIKRGQVLAAIKQIAEPDRERIERIFTSHDAPVEGYAVREVAVFGLSEMERAQQCLDLLKAGDAAGLGRLMKISHDGDRVSFGGTAKRKQQSPNEKLFSAWVAGDGTKPKLAELPGSYACSLPQLDDIADTAMQCEGVSGAQLAGAGLGGCVMALVHKNHTSRLVDKLQSEGRSSEVFRPIAGACSIAKV
jgi:N-acetylgalactosamine kinase